MEKLWITDFLNSIVDPINTIWYNLVFINTPSRWLAMGIDAAMRWHYHVGAILPLVRRFKRKECVMVKPNYQTSLQMNEEDFEIKEKLVSVGISIIDTWRRGAQELLAEIKKDSS